MKSVDTARRRPRRWSLAPVYVALSFFSLLFLAPYYVMVRNAVSSRQDITSGNWRWFPAQLQFESLRGVFRAGSPVVRGMGNSLLIASIQTMAQLVIAALAGYALARIRYRYRNVVFAALLATMMVPSAVTFIPTFAVVAKLGWINTLAGIIVPGLFNVFMVFIYRQFFLDFPTELEEAGTIDGLGRAGVFVRIVLPNARGVTIALGSIGFINSWNAFLWPLVVGQDESTWTVQVAISSSLNSYSIDLPGLFAGSLASVLPLVIGFFVFQRYIVQGVKFSGVKG
ncbi:MAG: carbohydrate ABC transporter permease [Propionibacteriaceae bacterium]|nr:carbohydrate ABC transporter permease [Propionibacteriaceae bacterium]